MQTKENDYFEIDIFELLRAYWKNIWAIVLSAVIFAGVTFGYTEFVVAPKYESDVLVYVNNSSFSLGSTTFSVSSSELSAAQSLVDTYIVILQSRSMLTEVKNTAGLTYDIEELSRMISSEPVNNTEVFRITVESTSATEAELIANTIADILPDKIADVVDGSSMRIVDYAVVNNKKSAPKVFKDSVIAAFLGVVAACAIITVKQLTDTVIRDEDYLVNTYNLPILAVIPDLQNEPVGSYYSYTAS